MNCATKSALQAAALVASLCAVGACGGGAAIGERCAGTGDCENGLQCFDGVCTPRCEANTECGDGFRCDEGQCTEVLSAIGDSCLRELDCGPGQTCLVNDDDLDGDGLLAATCARQLPGATLGTPCSADDDCRSGSCNLGLCTEVCLNNDDCVGQTTCTTIPRETTTSPALFSGCFQEGGVLDVSLQFSASHALSSLLIPGNARSIAITTQTGDRDLVAGVSFLSSPTGAVLYRTPLTLEAFLANPIRYAPALRESTLLAPNRPDFTLTAGSYPIRAGTSFGNGSPAQDVPSVRVTYKLHDSAILDVNVYILDLENHPCEAEIGGGQLEASTAEEHPGLSSFKERLRVIFDGASIELGTVTFHDVVGHPELDALETEDLSDLLPLAKGGPGLNLFLVRSLEPGGVQVVGGGNPAAPRLEGSYTAGVALSMDTLCYRDWPTAARLVAHAFGRQMGLFRNREPDSAIEDPIDDSSPNVENLMFFTEFGGIEVSPGQAEILRNYPGLR